MRKFLFFIMLLPVVAAAQTKFGYYNYSEVLKLLPQYNSVQADYESLLKKCDKEILRNEEELTRCYVAFLEGQSEFPEPILRKRQKELQELVDKSVIFRTQLRDWLTEARDSLFAPLRATIDDAVARVCIHNNLAYAIDLEKGAYTFVNPQYGFDITDAIIGTVKLLNNQEVNIPAVTVDTTEGAEEKPSAAAEAATDATDATGTATENPIEE